MSTARDKFLALLRDDILQLDLAELDFGIYRILNYRRKEIDAFLDTALPQRIEAALRALPGAPTEDEQGRIFHHLYTFFSRYYDDGDFVTRPRRGRDAAYSVPYNGQDVHFWWATRGSHYVKSGERFAGYVWRDGPRTIRIDVAQADVEKDNVKGARRYYLPESLDEADGQLRLQLAYRPLTAEEARRFDTRRKANEDSEDSEDSNETIEGRSAQERILNAWLDGAGARKARIPAGVDKALLRKHVARYVAGQGTDFFVHPQLGSFLSGELDYYLKNEFLEIWDRADGDALARERGKLTVARDVGLAIIAFLAAIEDVQAQLFEKRKCVLASHWLARVSALPGGKAAQALVAEACANPAQVNEWLAWLGEKPLAKTADAGRATKRGAELLAAYPHLCLHTRHFDETFKYRLLALYDDIEAATGGTLIHAENYAALRTLDYAYKQRVKCIYIDPPYNAPSSQIPYLNDFRESSWLSLIKGRLVAAKSLRRADGSLVIAIDENEQEPLGLLLNETEEGSAKYCVTVVHNPRGIQGDLISHTNEYAYFTFPAGTSAGMRVLEEGKSKPLMKTGSESERSTARNCFYSIDINAHGEILGFGDVPPSSFHPKAEQEKVKGGLRLWPISTDGSERKWRYSRESIERVRNDLFATVAKSSGRWTVQLRKDEEAFRTVWTDAKYNAAEYGSTLLRKMIPSAQFAFPKSIFTVSDSLVAAGVGTDDTTVDYFAGSGTTAHAVINLNRDDGGARRFVLVEQGEYFDSVLLPRVAKVIAAPEWKDGKPRPGQAMQAAAGEEADAHWSARSPALVQVLRLERYEDSLDALELPDAAAARRAGQRSFGDDTLLRYVQEASAGSGSVSLNHTGLARPFDYVIPQTRDGAPALVPVDLATTALLLLGLHPVRVRDVQRKLGRKAQRYLMVEARPNGRPKELHLLFLRDTDDSLTGEALRHSAEAEMHWLDAAIAAEFARAPADYAIIWHNRDAIVSSPNARSLDAEVVRRMLERAPPELAP